MSVRDTRMMAKALQQRWPINDKLKVGIVGALVKVLSDPNASSREKVAAARALLAAEAQNQADEHKLIDGHLTARDSELSRIASDLGIDPRLIVNGSVEADSSVVGTTQSATTT